MMRQEANTKGYTLNEYNLEEVNGEEKNIVDPEGKKLKQKKIFSISWKWGMLNHGSVNCKLILLPSCLNSFSHFTFFMSYFTFISS